jgi:hypothetical protein
LECPKKRVALWSSKIINDPREAHLQNAVTFRPLSHPAAMRAEFSRRYGLLALKRPLKNGRMSTSWFSGLAGWPVNGAAA